MTVVYYLLASSSSWPSKWIGPNADGTSFSVSLPGTYVYQLSFVSTSYYSASSSVKVFFLVDDTLTSVSVSDGSTTIQTITTFSGSNSFTCFSSFTLNVFGPTTTILTFTVYNIDIGNNPTSLLVQFGESEYIASCPTPAPTSKSTHQFPQSPHYLLSLQLSSSFEISYFNYLLLWCHNYYVIRFAFSIAHG